jgi:tyrosine-protein phosphatase SIW14
MSRFAFLFLFCLCGCAHHITHGIPNFAQVDSRLYRGGQPTPDGWRYLKSIGVRNVIKLNTQAEGVDDYVNFNVYESPVTLGQQLGLEPMPPHFGVGFDSHAGSSFVHCEHGQDRTGLFVAIHRVRVDGWTKAQAEKEMLSMGFHRSLHGLWEFWESFKPSL